MGQWEPEDGPEGTRGRASRNQRMGQREPEDGPTGTRGWAKGNQRVEASMGPQTRGENIMGQEGRDEVYEGIGS